MEWACAVITYQVLLVVAFTQSEHVNFNLSKVFSFKVAPMTTDDSINFHKHKIWNETDTNPIQFVLPFKWSYLQKIKGTPKKLGNCCTKDKPRKNFQCLASPLPVCLTPQSSSKCLYFSIKHWTSNEELMRGCCCELKVDKHSTSVSQQTQVTEVQLAQIYGKAGKNCVCLIIESDSCEGDINSDEGRRKCLRNSAQTKVYRRRKRGTISNPMIYPSFRHINERKRANSNPGSNFEVKMESGSMGMGNGNWSMSSGFNYDDFGRRRYKRELHVLVTRYSKNMNERRKRSPSWPSWSQSRRSMNGNGYRGSNRRYFRENDDDGDITTTPFTFLNVSFTGYTEVRTTTTTTTTEKPKTLKMTKNDREFVHGKKKEEPKPKFEAVLENGPSQLRIRVE